MINNTQTVPAVEPDSAQSTAGKQSPAPPSQDRASGVTAVVRRFARLVPTVLILAALAGLGYLGHETGWSMSKFSALIGQQPPQKDDWCEEHGVPESICIACNANLMPKPKVYDWCEKHGVHECPLEHPELAELDKVPEVEKRDLERADRALKLRPRQENNSGCRKHLRRIQFATKEDADKAGIDIDFVQRKKVVESITASGEITYDQTRVARLSTRAGGTVWRVYRNVGDMVRKGDVLALIDASDVGRNKADLLAAVTDYDLKKIQRDQLRGVAGGGVAERVLQEAEAALAAAQIRVQRAAQTLVNLGFPVTARQVLRADRGTLAETMLFLGLPREVSRRLDPEKTTSNLIPLRAPDDGVVVARDVVSGEVVDTKKVLFSVVDTSRMWLMLNVAMENARFLKPGRKVLFRPDGGVRDITGRISWISTRVDPHTRTVKARIELPNSDGTLRDETFGDGQIVLREEPGAIVVPNEALHTEGCCQVVFVRDRNYLKDGSYKVFHTRVVRTGVRTATDTEIIAGVLPWEVVVTKGGDVLRAELLKGNLGPG